MDLYLSEETDLTWFRPLKVVLPGRRSKFLRENEPKSMKSTVFCIVNYNGECGGPHFQRVWHHPKMFESPLTFFEWRYRSILWFKSIQSFWEPLELELCNFFSKDPPPSWRYFNNHVHITTSIYYVFENFKNLVLGTSIYYVFWCAAGENLDFLLFK